MPAAMPSDPPPLTDLDLPDDPAALKARLAAMEAENADLAEEGARLKAIVAAFRQKQSVVGCIAALEVAAAKRGKLCGKILSTTKSEL